MLTRLGIGSAQFGLGYGITNGTGVTSIEEVQRILEIGGKRNLEWVDTARGYGCAEEALGRSWPKDIDIKVVTKVNPGLAGYSIFDSKYAESSLRESLRLLKKDKLNGLLIHDAAIFRSEGGRELRKWLSGLKERELVEKIGISIYADEDLQQVEQDFLDIIQVPLSLYDQRALGSERVLNAKSLGTCIHARSVYMQGLLLQCADKWPSWMPPQIIKKHRELERLCHESRVSLVDIALGYIKSIGYADVAFIGICSSLQMKQLLDAWENDTSLNLGQYHRWAIEEKDILDPRKWPQG